MLRFPYVELAFEQPRRFMERARPYPQPEDLMLSLRDEFLKQRINRLLTDAETTLTTPKNKFQVNLDVQHFKPDEIDVKTAEGFIIVECEHEERGDGHGWVSRKFKRRYPIPQGVDAEYFQSRLSSDGVLSIMAPLNQPKASNERIVPIIQTGPVSTKPDEARDEIRTPVDNMQNGQ